MSIKRHVMRAFTLLEVLLTLAMSVVLMGLIGAAFQFYAVDMNVRNMDIQQTQLAAAVMQMIEDDLRATLRVREFVGGSSDGTGMKILEMFDFYTRVSQRC